METWRRIKEFQDYAVSKTGKIKNIKSNKIINSKKIFNSNYVYMYRDKKQYGRSVGQLVGIAFIPNPKKYKFINHIDSDIMNDHYTNLEWVKDSRKAKCENSKIYKIRSEPDHAWISRLKKLESKEITLEEFKSFK